MIAHMFDHMDWYDLELVEPEGRGQNYVPFETSSCVGHRWPIEHWSLASLARLTPA